MKTKVIIIGLLFFILLPEFLDAQPWRKRRYRRNTYGYAQNMYYGVGPKFGVQFMEYNMKFDGPPGKYEFKPDFSYHIGFSGEYFIKYNINLRADLQYSHRKLILDYNYDEKVVDPNDDNLPDHVNWTIGYITIPARVNYNFIYYQYVKGYLSLGVAPEFKTQDMETVTYLSGRTNDNFKLLYSNMFNKLNLGFSGSVGFKFNYNAHIAFEIEGGVMQYVGRLNANYSTGPPRMFYGEFGVFYDFQ
jgi:hypothetical protein